MTTSFYTDGVLRMDITSTRWLLYGVGSRNSTGVVMCTPDDSISQARTYAFSTDNNYIEWIRAPGNNAIGTTYFISDIRKKDNIQPTEFNSLELIDQINFIQFDWKPEFHEGHVKIGIAAQQMADLDKQSIITLSDGYLQIFEPVFMVHNAKALQQLKEKLDNLITELQLLKQIAIDSKNKIAELKQKISEANNIGITS